MAAEVPQEVTRILQAWRGGDQQAADALFALVYDELHVLAGRQRQRWQGDYTLNTTALVHEAYLKLTDRERVSIEDRSHFFALASKAMRHILSNYAKRQRRQKRGGDQVRLELSDVQLPAPGGAVSLSDAHVDALVALDEALALLEGVSERQSQVVECRFYGGMTVPETATALDISPATVKRDWAVAQAWLYREMKRLMGED